MPIFSLVDRPDLSRTIRVETYESRGTALFGRIRFWNFGGRANFPAQITVYSLIVYSKLNLLTLTNGYTSFFFISRLVVKSFSIRVLFTRLKCVGSPAYDVVFKVEMVAMSSLQS